MKLSVIIVNYNVKYFLEQCLHSVYKAIKNLPCEVFVVDNNSVDGSCAMVKEKFPQVILIENKKNTGFSVANNQAIRLSKGEYVLLLNPDTVVQEDTFTKTVEFMDQTPDAGGLGCKMIDGKGTFLPESKRGLPTPQVAFYKIFGLSKIFPKSKRFGRYHLGFLPNNQIHQIDVLAGAFMLMRKLVLNKVGLLDEDYFMYGEDIDLSYRITKGGYKNYYYPHTTIIHYKGESTKKGSINYVKMFYNAMIIFARKHFSKKNVRVFSFFINLAIYFRALLAIISRAFKALVLPVIDIVALLSGFLFIAPKWETVKYPDGSHFPDEYFLFFVPTFIIVWLLSIWLNGGYEKPLKLIKLYQGIGIGTAIILVVYALLPEGYRFSRAMILLATAWSFVFMSLSRLFLHFFTNSNYKFDFGRKNRIALVGLPGEAKRVLDIINQSGAKYEYIGLVNPDSNFNNSNFIGNISQLKDIIAINKINELIFCATNIQAQQIISEMLKLEGLPVNFKIAPPESLSIIGSNSIDTAGELYTVDFNNITKQSNRRNKRLFDIIMSLMFIATFPILIFIVKQRKNFIANILEVLAGLKSWVGFYTGNNININKLPKIKKGVLSWLLVNSPNNIDNLKAEKSNLLYAKNYRVITDLVIIAKGIKYLGNW